MTAMARALLVASLIVCGTGPAHAEGTLADARALYESARYEEALTLLDTLRQAPDVGMEAIVAIEEDRAYCLLGLGRTGDAETALATAIRGDALRRPDDTRASPRVRAIFRATRARLLPELVQRDYVAARASLEQREYAAAGLAFDRVLSLIDDPDMAGRSRNLRVLVEGFRDLSAARLSLAADQAAAWAGQTGTRSETSSALTRPPTIAAPVSARTVARSIPPPGALPPAPGAPPPARTDSTSRIYTASDGDVAPPMVQTQQLPAMERTLKGAGSSRGVVELVIGEGGDVETAVMRVPCTPGLRRPGRRRGQTLEVHRGHV